MLKYYAKSCGNQGLVWSIGVQFTELSGRSHAHCNIIRLEINIIEISSFIATNIMISETWPLTVPPPCRLRARAEAYANALYYGECSLNGVSSDGAAAAEEVVRSKQTKWWLPGNNPNHPALQTHPLAHWVITSADNGLDVGAKSLVGESSVTGDEVVQYEQVPQMLHEPESLRDFEENGNVANNDNDTAYY